VTGSRWAGGEEQMLTLGFDTQGALTWERVTPGATRGLAACRAAGGVCSAGGTSSAVAALVSAAGTPLWDQSVAPAGYADFRPVALRAAGDDYLYAAGSAERSAGGSAALLIRYLP
jgi:hypothetical protein